MKGLEKAIRTKYKSLHNKNIEKETALRTAQNWAEEWIVRTNGKLTISSENEIQQILNKLRIQSTV